MARDPLGNEIKENSLVILNLNGHPVMARVAQVRPGGVIGRSRDALPVAGLVALQVIVPIEHAGDQVDNVWVLAAPSNQDLAAKKAMSEVPS